MILCREAVRRSPSRNARGAVVAVASTCVLWFACTASEPDDAPPLVTGDAADGSREVGTMRDAGPPAVRFVGRFDTRDDAGSTCGWPGCRITARFSGTAVTTTLDERVESWMQGGPSEWDVSVDGILRPKLVLEPGKRDYPLAEGLPPGPHRIDLYKRTETQNGYTQFRGFDFHGGTLLPPPLPALRRIEVIGDSASAGFGIEGNGEADCPGPDWAARWQNFRKSYGARLGEIFDADLNGTVYSGKGLTRNIWRPDLETMPTVYGRANPVDPTSVFDLRSFVPDVVIVMIGGNDFDIGQPADNGPASLVEFTEATRAFVAKLRSTAAQAHVLLTVSPSVSDAEPAGRNTRTNVSGAFETVAKERRLSGDARVYSVAPPPAIASELTGCLGHGSPAYHERVAQQLAATIRQKTGW